MKGWSSERLGDLVVVQNGYAFSSADYSLAGHFVMRIANVQNGYVSAAEPKYIRLPTDGSLNRFVLSEGDILMSLTGHIGRVGIVEEQHLPAVLNQRVARINVRPSAQVSRGYLLHFLQSDGFRDALSSAGHGVAQQNVSTKELVEINLPVPCMTEQSRIVAILDEAFAGIATAKANAANARKKISDLSDGHLRSLFLKFSNTRAKIMLGELCKFVRGPFGGSLKKSIFVADGFAVYEQQHAIYDQFDDVRYFVDEKKFHEMARFEISPNDLIMSCSGTMGRVAIVPAGIRRGIINQALLKLTPSPRILSSFLKLWMESESFQDALQVYSGGAAIQNVASVKILKDIAVPLPSLVEQRQVVESAGSFRSETQRLESIYTRKLTALDELKQSLLHQAFSGQL